MHRTGDIDIKDVKARGVVKGGNGMEGWEWKLEWEADTKIDIVFVILVAVLVAVLVFRLFQDGRADEDDDDDLEDMCEYRGRDVVVLPASKKDYTKHLSNLNSIYQITRKPKGNVLIVNNTKFPVWGAGKNIPSGEREGMLIRKLFERLGCKVKEANNKTAPEMRKELEKFAGNPCHNHADFSVVFILSHGARVDGDDLFYGTDGDSVGVSYAIELFENDKCTSLKNKPKLFFFEFCRVEPAHEADAENNLAEGNSYPDGVLPSPADMSERHMTTTRGDMLLTFATLEGDLSNDRFFTNAMLNVFSKKSKKKNIIEMLNEVKRGMDKESADKWQMADTRGSNLTKTFYFFPGFPRPRARNRWDSFKYWVTDTFL